MHCIESSDLWANKLKEKIAEKNIQNVNIDVYPYDPDDPAEYAHSDNLACIQNRYYDVILVDGYEKDDVPLRPICFRQAENQIQKGGIIIVDDSWRYLSLRTDNRAKSWQEFRSIGPCRPGVTTTDIYFY